jgi:hypothetical protein
MPEQEIETDYRLCPVCEKQVAREEMSWTNDCHGITFRLVCNKCWDSIMETKDYDGEYYSEQDEEIYEDY